MYVQYQQSAIATDFMYKVFGWMSAALALTAGTAYYIFSTPSVFQAIFSNFGIVIALFIGQIALVSVLAFMLNRLSFAAAAIIFIAYSVTTGVTLSTIFYQYELGSIYLAFGIAAAMFGGMALYGYLTHEDLTSMGSILSMGVWGLVIAMVINIFLRSTGFDFVISLFGVAIFTLLIAYDVQKIKTLSYQLLEQGEMSQKVALLGALKLYLDFLNLFLFLLRVLGKQKQRD